MKEQILEALWKHDQDRYGVDMRGSGIRTINVEKAADDLMQLMCYREVRAYFKAYDEFYGELSWDEFTQEVMGSFSEYYPEAIITAAIERVKS